MVIATTIVAITLPLNIADIIPCTLEPNSSPSELVSMLIEKVVANANTIPAIAYPKNNLILLEIFVFNL